MKNHLTILSLLLLTGCSDFIFCGWTHVGTRQLEDAPAGRCWLLVTPPDMATTLVGSDDDTCDVKEGDRIYQGGAVVDFWGSSSFEGGLRDFHAEGVGCPEP